MRKDLKSLRYATEFFLPLYPTRKARSFLQRLQRLQDVFGYLNDVVMLRQVFAVVVSAEEDQDELLRDAVAVYRWHRKRADLAWLDARKRWAKLEKCKRFWL